MRVIHMRINRRAAREPSERKPVDIKLGHGAVLQARPLDSFEHKMVLAEARGELNALLANEATKRKWASIPKSRIAEAKGRQDVEGALLSWMHAVLLATASGVALHGVVELTDEEAATLADLEAQLASARTAQKSEDEETRVAAGREAQRLEAEIAAVGKPLEVEFETFELLFTDVSAESAFKMQAYKVEEIWAAEKNVSGPGPNGSGPVETKSAAPAVTPVTPAPLADNEALPLAADSVPIEETPATPQKASSPGPSLDQAASGSLSG
jgi:hypothetical protein